jgi:hypothetical protein
MAENGIIAVQIRRSRTGLFTATSETLEGVYVAHRDLTKIVADLPNIIRHWFKTHRKEDVVVFTAPAEQSDDMTSVLAKTVPAEIAAQAIAR